MVGKSSEAVRVIIYPQKSILKHPAGNIIPDRIGIEYSLKIG